MEANGNITCKACSQIIGGSKAHLERHAKTSKHIRNDKSTKNVTTIKSFSTKTNVSPAVEKIVMFLVEHNISFKTVDHLTQLIKELSINSRWGEIEKLKCNRTKATKITVDRFGPKQEGNLVKILQKVKFSLLIDETTDVNLSNRKSTMLLSSIAKSSTESNSKYSLSYSTLSRQRIVHRKNIAYIERIKNEFSSNKDPFFVIHWDGKIRM